MLTLRAVQKEAGDPSLEEGSQQRSEEDSVVKHGLQVLFPANELLAHALVE